MRERRACLAKLVKNRLTLTDVSPRWLRRTALSCEFTPPSIMLLVDGSGPALARAGSRWIGNTYLDDSGRDSPASLNSTGDM